jgi:hypothetical protein
MASPEISSNKMPAHTTLVFIGSRFLGLGENNAPAGAARRPPEADAGLAGALDPHIGARQIVSISGQRGGSWTSSRAMQDIR